MPITFQDVVNYVKSIANEEDLAHFYHLLSQRREEVRIESAKRAEKNIAERQEQEAKQAEENDKINAKLLEHDAKIRAEDNAIEAMQKNAAE